MLLLFRADQSEDVDDKRARREVVQVLVGVVCRISRHISARARRLRLVYHGRRCSYFSVVRSQRGHDCLGDCARQWWTHQPGCHHRILCHAQDQHPSVYVRMVFTE